MSGNFDHPPASASSNTDDLTSFPARLRHIRQAFQQDRERRDRDRREADRQARHAPTSTSAPRPSSHRRRRMPPRPDPQPRTDGASREEASPPDMPTSALRPRPRPPTLERLARRRRQQRDLRDETSSTLNALGEAGERLAEISSRLGALLEPSRPLAITRVEDGEGPEGLRPRSKRRKLDHDAAGGGFQGFKYGHYGQIVPGNLKMEIVSCDGGEYSEEFMSAYRAENVLKDDRSVYCTKTSHCNLILRHQGETTFCLEKIVIRAPERGFTAPVQQGMIFVSMTSEDLIRDTEQYDIQYNSSPQASPDSNRLSRRQEQLSLLESLHDPEVWEGYRSYHRHIEYLNSVADTVADTVAERAMAPRLRYTEAWPPRPPPPARALSESSTTPEHYVWPLTEPSSLSSALDPSAPPPPPFTVTTESDGEQSGAVDGSGTANQTSRQDLRRPRAEIFDDNEDDDDDDDSYTSISFVSRTSSDLAARSAARAAAQAAAEEEERLEEAQQAEARQAAALSSRRSRPRRIAPRAAEADEGEGEGEGEGDGDGEADRGPGESRAVPNGPDVRKPHAEFFIAKNRSKITVKFDPPVSGKFVLLKLWSPRREANIDIQHVAAFGFAGPRYFPACQLR